MWAATYQVSYKVCLGPLLTTYYFCVRFGVTETIRDKYITNIKEVIVIFSPAEQAVHISNRLRIVIELLLLIKFLC